MSGEVVLVIDGREFEIAHDPEQDVDEVFRDTQERIRKLVGAHFASREVFSIRSEDWTGAIDLYVNPTNIGYATVYQRTSYEPYSGFAQR